MPDPSHNWCRDHGGQGDRVPIVLSKSLPETYASGSSRSVSRASMASITTPPTTRDGIDGAVRGNSRGPIFLALSRHHKAVARAASHEKPRPPKARARGPVGGWGWGVRGTAIQINGLTRPAFQARRQMVRRAAAS